MSACSNDLKKDARERMQKCVQTFQARPEEAAHRAARIRA